MIGEKGELIFIVNKCTERGCKAYLRICNNKNVVWQSSNFNHSHNPDGENKLERQFISNGLKRKFRYRKYM
ncbi:hypothetical protein QTP88_015085 [Uroleucon formosanum]